MSITLKGTMGGHDALITARGSTWEEFAANIARLQGLLDAVPVPAVAPVPSAAAGQPTPEGWCLVHQVQMTRQSTPRGSWWSHPKPDGGWCKGK